MLAKSPKLRIVFILVFLVASGFLVYAGSLKNPLFWDDEVTIIGNVFIRDVKYLKEIFTSGYHQGAGEISNLYRPLAVLSFLFEYQLWGLSSFDFHLDNIILHILNAILLFFLARLVLKKEGVACLAAALFLVHPQATEVVNYASHRPELLLVLFSLLALICYIKFTASNKKIYLLLSLLCYSLAILSKEMGIILVLFILLYNIFAKRRNRNKYILLYLAPLAVYLFFKATALNFLKVSLLKGPQLNPYSENLIERLLIFAKAFFIYLKVLFFPVGLHMERDIPYLSGPFDFKAAAAGLFILITLVYLVMVRKKRPEIFFSGLWFILGLLPVSGIIPINTAVAEHYLYLPAIGFFMLSAVFARDIYRKLPLTAVFFAVIFIVLAGLSVKRNKEWNDPSSLYLSTVKNARHSFRANNNLGVEYFRKGDLARAEEYFRKSLDIMSIYAPALNNMGVISERQGKDDEAISYYKRAVEGDPNYLLAYKNLADIYLRSGRKEEAREALGEILKRYPFDADAADTLRSISE